MYPWTKKFPLNIGNNPNPESGSEIYIRIRTLNPDHLLLGGRIWSLTALVLTQIITRKNVAISSITVYTIVCKCNESKNHTLDNGYWPTVNNTNMYYIVEGLRKRCKPSPPRRSAIMECNLLFKHTTRRNVKLKAR